MKRYWHELPSSAFADLAPDTVAILPIGAIEQHGPHLPVYVDTCINEGLLDIALDKMPESMPVLVLPTQSVGKSNEHIAFPGTLTISHQTIISMLIELGESVHRAGINRLILLNSHGGQPQIMDVVARELRVRHNMFVVVAAWYAMGMPKGLFSPEECRHGIHGGEIETSLMLHLRPDLVDMNKAGNFASLSIGMEDEYDMLSPEGNVGFGWMAQDLHPGGACGNAAAADAERGRLLAEHAAARFVTLADEVSRFPLQNLRSAQT